MKIRAFLPALFGLLVFHPAWATNDYFRKFSYPTLEQCRIAQSEFEQKFGGAFDRYLTGR